MPIVDDDDQGLPPETKPDVFEQVQLNYENLKEKIKKKRKFHRELLKRLPPKIPYMVDVNARSLHYNIEVWEFNKIREILKKIYHSDGMMLSVDYHDTFLWRMAINVQDGWMIMPSTTFQMWKMDFWKYGRLVKVGFVGTSDDWSSFFDMFKGLLGIGSMIEEAIKWTSVKEIPVYENFAYKNTIGSDLIILNWDKILKDLNEHGY